MSSEAEKKLSEMTVQDEEKKESGAPAPAAAPVFAFNFASGGAPAPAAAAPGAAQPFQFNFGGAGGAAAPAFSFPAGKDAKKKSKKEEDEDEDDEDDEDDVDGEGDEGEGDEDDDLDSEAAIRAFIESLPEWSQARLIGLQTLHEERDAAMKLYREEIRQIELKYEGILKPIYDKRAGLISGGPIDKDTYPKAAEMAATLPAEDATKPIDKFWLTAMQNCRVVSEQITDEDEAVLEYLTDIRSSITTDHIGFKLEFHFQPNVYFTDTVLTKEYTMEDDEEPVLLAVKGCEINWNPGKSTCFKLLKKKQKSGKKSKVVTKQEPCPSFFNFFSPPDVLDDDDAENMDEEEAQMKSAEIDLDYDMAMAFKEAIIPHGVKYFTGEADDDDEDQDYEDEDGDIPEGDEDEDDDDDGPDMDPKAMQAMLKSMAGGKGGRGRGRGRGADPECKQQ